MKVLTKGNKGFTLIELLVVIAIIGLLSSIVLVSLAGARNKARDARIQGDMGQIRSMAELVYTDKSAYSYATLCLAGGPTLNVNHPTYATSIDAIATDIDTQNGAGAAPTCYGDAYNYCVSASTTGATICVSSNGKTGSIACTVATTDCR